MFDAYEMQKESKHGIAKGSITIDQDLPRNIFARIMKNEDRNINAYAVWIEIDELNRVTREWSFLSMKEAEDFWKKIVVEIENERYNLVLHVNGMRPEIFFPGIEK